MSEWITTKKASELLGVSVRSIQRYVKSGRLKAKIMNGKSLVREDNLSKVGNINADLQNSKSKPVLDIPDGYILIDKSTLDSLRAQIQTLTQGVAEMQLTQKMLIEKGLNLTATASEISSGELQAALPEPAPGSDKPEIISPISEVAKAHEDFFGKKKNARNYTWLIISGIALIVIIVLIVLNSINAGY